MSEHIFHRINEKEKPNLSTELLIGNKETSITTDYLFRKKKKKTITEYMDHMQCIKKYDRWSGTNSEQLKKAATN